jgi:DNA-binding response OmpR family regulator
VFSPERSAAESSFYYGLKTGMAPAPKQILVVDDDPQVRGLVAGTVRRAGFRADTAEDGEEGWTALCRTSYDLLITDHEMPRLTGLKLIERLRAVSMEPPCILISGNMPGTDCVLLKILHPGAILEKPFLPNALIELIYDFLLENDL